LDIMRYTIIDQVGTISFVADCEVLEILVAACAENPANTADLLALSSKYDPRVEDYVSSGLAIFDEHNVPGEYASIHSALKHLAPHELPVFRVIDSETRRMSLHPVKAGIVLFNLRARRIIQVQNTYSEVQRRGRLIQRTDSGRNRVLRYELPATWIIVP
jgi:hypothetical protein